MGNEVITATAGLQLSNNTFSASPPGSMSRATNLVINSKGVTEPRRGQAWASTMPAAADIPFALAEFQGAIIAQYGTSKTDTSQGLGYVNSGSISAYSGGPYNPVGDNGSAADYMRLKFCLASLFLHFSCSSGPKCLETYNGVPRAAGLSRMPDPIGAPLNSSFPNGWMRYNTSVAYRSLMRRPTSTGSILGPPSNAAIVTNRFIAPIGGLVRTGGTTVTATIWTSPLIGTHPFAGGADFTLSPGETNFAAGNKTATAIVVNGDGTTTVSWIEAGADVASTVAQEMEPNAAVTGSVIATQVRVYLPKTAATGDFVRLYRSIMTSDSTTGPNPDVYLCAERLLAGGDISAGYVDIFDYTPESVINEPLYTNSADGDGLGDAGGNFQPPIYGDVANFDGGTWYCDTLGQQKAELEMLGVGATTGVQDGDTLTIGATAFTFKTTPSAGTDVQIFASQTPSLNISNTTIALVQAINSNLRASGICAYGKTAPNSFPGKIRIERWDFGASFITTASRKATWTPALPVTSTNGAQANGLWNSKSQQPEAVPPINFRNVGTPNFYARRIFGLRNALIVLKEGDGIWSLTGSGGNYNLQQISTANTIAPDCACVFADSVWCYTDQGILRVSDSGGAQVVSRPIETALNELAIALPTETYASSFAVAYEVERRVMFFLPFEAATAATGNQPLMKAYCYSNATNAWTGPLEFNETPFSGIVSEEKHLWFGAYDGVFSRGRITEERKTGTYLDNAEAQWSNTLATTADPLVVALATAGAIQQGTGISQTVNGTTYQTKIAAVNGDGTYTLAETFPWANAACTIYDPYEVEPQFLPQSDPVTRKSLTRLASLFKQGAFANYYGSTTIETDMIQATKEIATPFVGYGLTPYGQGPYGNPTPMVVNTNPIAAQWSSAAQFFPGFLLDEVWCRFKMQGMAMTTLPADAPSNRGA